ncbi:MULTISPECIES: ArsR/SmtB family transcription factor [Bacillati]|uniref:Transcriptional regulator n=1 Tax=Niallia taxi TaxID=2499688 RepID=A0A437K746_9BACI|nr:metalloregulator ArsR/SmtB family transcription factor [Niallia taxi]MDK8643005.1 metalloregulator ArsR/SmtB family transcription factor [Niallia taxi]MED4038243.1 metalloregulator ArsR/SmtB family transcription factor [Niallia taxi]MED4055136.1 metalloregulator ArsR/SmtB family transcription factor [Niallia taxi]MED4120674.1 metalloregulator ArsR/SmtB family transcription factor [Niallia taxi]RVT59404.1 transcriptional regulator [Niallia taxi]
MKKKDTCEIYCYDEEKVTRIQSDIEKVNIGNLSQMFKLIADENRAKITYALCQVDELCVCDVANIIGSSVANASHHLRTLHKQGFVKYRKEGKLAFYSLEDEYIRQILMIALKRNKEVMVNV